MSCITCNLPSELGVMAVRTDGELIDDASYCRQHALEILVSGRMPLKVPLQMLLPLIEDCLREGTESPEGKSLCGRGCGRHADLWLTAGLDEELDDLSRGVELCGSCAADAIDGVLPVEVRKQLRESLLPWAGSPTRADVEEQVLLAILHTEDVYSGTHWREWAVRWRTGKDRGWVAARGAMCAVTPIDETAGDRSALQGDGASDAAMYAALAALSSARGFPRMAMQRAEWAIAYASSVKT